MKFLERKKAVLLLEDGTTFYGISIGKKGTTSGELCFNTGMTGYQEIYTDPSYFGQIVINTTAHIGNYGVKANEVESDSVKIAGLVVKNFSHVYSRYEAASSLQQYLEEFHIVGIAEIDTRMLVRHIRQKGAMNGIISSEVFEIEELKKMLAKVPSMAGLELSSKVSTRQIYDVGEPSAPLRVAVLDLGIKKNILRNLVSRGVYCRVFPMDTPFEVIQNFQPDGYFISNGPGDPAAMPATTQKVKQMLMTEKPLFGICLGHQILAQAVGVSTYKMHHGHRGCNHPVKNLLTGKAEITSQNHGFAVSAEDIQKNPDVEVTHINLNDNTIEGIRLKRKRAFSVQYHPESAPGPHDSRYLFDSFVMMMKDQ
ncbi:MAG: glutamine-hydrolyzing carbamoyl-phosphate synthase small subunit [Cytophagales bacterium]|nr:glutamine-hydrolyzing carbamoyl-phosphate synthase small subunit [Cytophagales bacterium]MDW8384845.1 glutamine-hydrolyzing carbamoyl-phosphate synthase small subunit [Flammeovirgaceae bacterium]